MEKKVNQVKLALTRDAGIRHLSAGEVKVPSSVAAVNLVGGAKPSSPASPSATTLTQTHLFTAKPKVILAPTVPRIKSVTTMLGKHHQQQTHVLLPHIKTSPAAQVKPSLPAQVKLPSRKPSLSGMKAQSARTISQPLLSAHTKPLSPHTSHSKPQSAHPKLSASHSKPLQSPYAKTHPSHSTLSYTKPLQSSSAKPLPPPLPQAKLPPPLIKVATKGKPATQKTATGIKTITVKLPPSLISSSAPPTSKSALSYGVTNTSQTVTVKFPSSITSSALSLLTTIPTIPLVKTNSPVTTSVAPSTSHEDHTLSPPKAKKAKVMKAALLPMSRIKTIMKTNIQSSQPSLLLSQDSVLVIAKATELFISELSQGAQKATPTNVIGYNPLASSVQTNDKFQFLRDIVPKKVLAKDYLQQQSK